MTIATSLAVQILGAGLTADLRSALDPAVLFETHSGSIRSTGSAAICARRSNTVLLKGRQVGASPVGRRARHPHRALLVRCQRGHRVAVVEAVDRDHHEGPHRPAPSRRSARPGLDVGAAPRQRVSASCRCPERLVVVRGWTAKLLILDEAAFIAPDTFTAARALVATGGRLVVQSTPAIETGDFHELVTGDDPDWSRLVVRSDEVPTITPRVPRIRAARHVARRLRHRVRVQVRQGGRASSRACSRRNDYGSCSPITRKTPRDRLRRVASAPRAAHSWPSTTTRSRRRRSSSSACPYDLGRVADRVRELVAAGHRVTIDLDGRGESLRLLLGRQPGVRWYRKTGRERRELTDMLDATRPCRGSLRSRHRAPRRDAPRARVAAPVGGRGRQPRVGVRRGARPRPRRPRPGAGARLDGATARDGATDPTLSASAAC